MLLQLRYRYAAGFPGSLPAGDINPVRELGRSVIRPRAAARPRSTRFEPEGRLRSFNARVPCVHLPISLAAPRLSGSASPSRRCQGCCPPAPASPGAGCPQLLSGRCDSQRAKALHLRTFQWRLVAHEVGHPLGFGFQRREIPFQQIPDARRWQSRAASRPAPLPPAAPPRFGRPELLCCRIPPPLTSPCGFRRRARQDEPWSPHIGIQHHRGARIAPGR